MTEKPTIQTALAAVMADVRAPTRVEVPVAEVLAVVAERRRQP